MEYVIRAIKENELTRLVEMCSSHAEYEKAAYNSCGRVQALKSAIFSEKQKLYCFVVEVGTEIVGHFAYTIDFSTWDAQTFLHLDCLYLESAYRGMRIGDKIIEKLIAIGKENNCVNIQWQTPVFNEKAIKFYNRIGATGKEKMRFFLSL